MSTPRNGRDMRFWEQLEILNEALPADKVAVAGPQGATPDSDVLPEFAYLAEHVLVRAPDVERTIQGIQASLPSGEPVRVVWPADQDARRVTIRRLSIGSRDVFRALAVLRQAKIPGTLHGLGRQPVPGRRAGAQRRAAQAADRGPRQG
jgi:hypothetical protein